MEYRKVVTKDGFEVEVNKYGSVLYNGIKLCVCSCWRKNKAGNKVRVPSCVSIRKNGKQYNYDVARLVAAAFMDGYITNEPIRYVDGNSHNPSLENLLNPKKLKVVSIEGEIWKPIAGFEGSYEVSNLGRVKSVERYAGGRYFNESILNTYNRHGGYKSVVLSKGSNLKFYLLHRIVADAFVENENNLPCINHKDENKDNNSASNLEWCTIKYNNNYGTRNTRSGNTRKKNIIATTESGEKMTFSGFNEAKLITGVCSATINAHSSNGKPYKGIIGR